MPPGCWWLILFAIFFLGTGWLGSRPDQLTAFGGAESGQVSTLVRFETGATALAAASVAGVGRPLLEVIVWGNRGILSWDGAYSTPLAPAGDADAGPSEVAARFLHMVQVSLRSGQSVDLRDGVAFTRNEPHSDRRRDPASPVPSAAPVNA